MRRVILVAALLALLGAANRALAQAPDTPAPTQNDRVAVPEPSEKALSYHRSGNVLWVVGLAWSLIVPLTLLWTGGSARIRDIAQRIGRRRFFVIGIYFIIFTIIAFVVDLPLAYYTGFVREHAYGLSNQTFGKWFGDAIKSLIVTFVFGHSFCVVAVRAGSIQPPSLVALYRSPHDPVSAFCIAHFANLDRPALQQVRSNEKQDP